MKFEFFGYQITVSREEADELERAKETLDRHGFRAVRKTADTRKKKESMKKANEIRVKKTEEKMNNALNLLRFQDVKITAYRLAKEAGVSQPTAAKFLKKFGITKVEK